MIGILGNWISWEKACMRETRMGKGLGDHVWSLMKRYCLLSHGGTVFSCLPELIIILIYMKSELIE